MAEVTSRQINEAVLSALTVVLADAFASYGCDLNPQRSLAAMSPQQNMGETMVLVGALVGLRCVRVARLQNEIGPDKMLRSVALKQKTALKIIFMF